VVAAEAWIGRRSWQLLTDMIGYLRTNLLASMLILGLASKAGGGSADRGQSAEQRLVIVYVAGHPVELRQEIRLTNAEALRSTQRQSRAVRRTFGRLRGLSHFRHRQNDSVLRRTFGRPPPLG
jgi:hypothetical protein